MSEPPESSASTEMRSEQREPRLATDAGDAPHGDLDGSARRLGLLAARDRRVAGQHVTAEHPLHRGKLELPPGAIRPGPDGDDGVDVRGDEPATGQDAGCLHA